MNRLVVSGAVAVGLVLGCAGVAQAEPTAPVTITLSPEQVANLCEKRLPKIEKRVNRLLERINADDRTRGSVAWLKAKAATERDAGRETSAQLLEEKAERRAGRVDDLTKVAEKVAEFQSQHCGSK